MVNRKCNRNPLPFSILLSLVLMLIFACIPPESIKTAPNLPSPGFKMEQTRSDLNRPARKTGKEYMGPIIDTHVHLDPPIDSRIQKKPLQEMMEKMERAGVVSMIVMPVPNEGHMRQSNGSAGAEQRKMLRSLGGGKIKLFCGAEYISNWLHDAYHNGFRESDFNGILSRLTQDLNDPDCTGIGEIGLYHFNKDGQQNVIEYPPTFEPFLKMIGRIAQKGVWVDLHAEPVDPHGKSYEKQVFGGLEILLQKYPTLKLIYSHTAMTNSTNARRILERYPNIMMNFKPIKRHNLWRNLEPITNSKGHLYTDWADLFETMPERFMVGTDEKFGRQGKGVHGPAGVELADYGRKIRNMRKILGSLNPTTAEVIAYKNAERIFK